MAKGTLVIRQDICKGCGLCVSACPVSMLEIDQSRINRKGYHPVTLAAPEECSGCAICALMCPDQVLTVYREPPARAGKVAQGEIL